MTTYVTLTNNGSFAVYASCCSVNKNSAKGRKISKQFVQFCFPYFQQNTIAQPKRLLLRGWENNQ